MSVQIRQLKNAPIVEALLDFRTELPPNFDIESVSSLPKRLEKKYRRKEKRTAWQSTLTFSVPSGASGHHQSPSRTDAYRFWSANNHEVVQLRRDGFAFSQLRPYRSWEPFVNEAKKLWRVYVAKASPIAVQRVAVRFINRIEHPTTVDALCSILRAPPALPMKKAGEVSDFVQRVAFDEPETEATVLVTTGLDRAGSRKKATVFVDIDIYREQSFSIEGKELWGYVERLREVKDEVFFRTLSDEALGRLE